MLDQVTFTNAALGAITEILDSEEIATGSRNLELEYSHDSENTVEFNFTFVEFEAPGEYDDTHIKQTVGANINVFFKKEDCGKFHGLVIDYREVQGNPVFVFLSPLLVDNSKQV